ncbi:dehydration-responsive protein RD22-like [Pyrus ussuriensis x Pyrus communis]|uniref:Dehydration-responsive protein RD22-like n=1 Tax=Pyrus ussuriensis x Pyrus communis TaxID=2448454 RepID=A0A5N5HQ56_9ROSA|nr:dehydration-responsive protein RD22-like [Pyrus ussuriensis x Pyrus communis]
MQLTLAGSRAAALPVPPPQLYWNSVLPNTPMPKFLSQLVKPGYKLPEILNKFSVKPESTAANLINSTIQECEHQVARNEAKQCATSLESMIDFATAILGKNVRAIATEVEKIGAAPIQKTYMVPLQGADGTKAKAVAACHEDTSGWVPNHYAFKELKVEPGTVPICHFLKVKEVTWVPNQKPN